MWHTDSAPLPKPEGSTGRQLGCLLLVPVPRLVPTCIPSPLRPKQRRGLGNDTPRVQSWLGGLGCVAPPGLAEPLWGILALGWLCTTLLI